LTFAVGIGAPFLPLLGPLQLRGSVAWVFEGGQWLPIDGAV